MRRGFIILAMLLGIALFQSVSAPSADAWHRHWGGWGHRWGGGWGWGHHRWHGGWGHHGWGHHGWGHHGWGHRNWGFGRGWVYRPVYRGYYGGYGYGVPVYNNFYPSVNYGYYPSYGYYDGCQTNYYQQPSYSQPIYETQTIPGGQFDAGQVIAQVASVIRERRASDPNGRLLSGNLLNGDGRLKGLVQNIVGGVVQNQPLNAGTVSNSGNITNVRFSNPDARSKARTYLTQGDNLFREQRYAAAAQQYRAAASMAPDLAEANWRYAHTLVAMGEYDLAVNAVDRALAASEDTARNGFNLDTLYGTVGTAKASHLEGLANAALENESPNAYFLLGMTMHYSGEAQRAEKFFARAAQIQGRDVTHLVAFLGPAPRAIPEPPPMLARLPAKET